MAERAVRLLHSGTTIDTMARRCVEAEAERDAFREALEKIAAEELGKPGVPALYAHQARYIALHALDGLK